MNDLVYVARNGIHHSTFEADDMAEAVDEWVATVGNPCLVNVKGGEIIETLPNGINIVWTLEIR